MYYGLNSYTSCPSEINETEREVYLTIKKRKRKKEKAIVVKELKKEEESDTKRTNKLNRMTSRRTGQRWKKCSVVREAVAHGCYAERMS